MNVSPPTWALRVVWLTLPLTLGDLVSAAIDGRSGPVRVTTVALAWLVWAAGLLASLVPRPVALTALRILAPLPLLAGVVSAVDSAPSPLGWIGLASAALLWVGSLSADIGGDFIDGASYGDERRFGLRPPGALLMGPLPLVWAATVSPVLSGALLLSAREWLPGAILVVGGAVAAWWGARVLHRLARRCLVFVPAGMTLVDDLALVEPVLFRRRDVTRIGPAPADTAAVDLSVAAPGLIVQIDVDPAVAVVPTVGRGRETAQAAAASVLIAPSRPGALLEFATQRDLAVHRG